MSDFVVVIPARYASTRLPGKPLRDINGRPMIEHVYRRGRESGARNVVIATDDERIADAAENFGFLRKFVLSLLKFKIFLYLQ